MGFLWPRVYFQNMLVLFMEAQHEILMRRAGDMKDKVGTLLAWMETVELTLQLGVQGSCRAEKEASSEALREAASTDIHSCYSQVSYRNPSREP